MVIDEFTNGGSPEGVKSRSQEVWGLRYIDDAMVRRLDKNEGGGHGTAGVRAMASGIGIERAMCRQAAQGTDVAEPTSVARPSRDARNAGATLPMRP